MDLLIGFAGIFVFLIVGWALLRNIWQQPRPSDRSNVDLLDVAATAWLLNEVLEDDDAAGRSDLD